MARRGGEFRVPITSLAATPMETDEMASAVACGRIGLNLNSKSRTLELESTLISWINYLSHLLKLMYLQPDNTVEQGLGLQYLRTLLNLWAAQ